MTGPPTHPQPAEPASAIGLLAMLLRHPRLLIAPPLALALLAGGIAIVRGPGYVSRAVLKPETREAAVGNFSGLAAQLGVSLAGLGGGEGVEYYVAALRSRQIMAAVVQADYRFSDRRLGDSTGDTLQGTLIELWGIEGPTPEVRVFEAIRRLNSAMTVRSDPPAGVLMLEVTSQWPELAVQINRRFLDALEVHNLETRQSRARAQRRFVEQRLADARADLELAEDRLTTFQDRNRLLQTPLLQLELQRLQRRVDVAQQVYLTLAQAFEQARIDEVRDTPVITVVDPPESTVEEAGGWVLLFLLGGFVGLLAGLAVIFLRERWERDRSAHPAEAAALTSALEQLQHRLLRGRGRSGANRSTAP